MLYLVRYRRVMSDPPPVNLTPHDVRVHVADGRVRVYRRSGHIARLVEGGQRAESAALVDGIPTLAPPHYTGVEGLPDRPIGPLIVTALVGEWLACNDGAAVAQPHGWLVPDMGPGSVVRDSKGRITGVRRFIRYV